jgi:hypothetical protein
MKNLINSKGKRRSPEQLKTHILIFAENRMLAEIEKEDKVMQYLEWIPFSNVLFTVKALAQGNRLSLRPVIDF